MARSDYLVGAAHFIADPTSIVRTQGRQIDWANVGAGYIDPATGKKVLPGGTVVGTLLGSGKVSPRVVTTNPAVGFLESDAIEGDENAPLTGYGVVVGGSVYEALLPDASGTPRTLASAIKSELDAARSWFRYETFADVR